MKQRPGQAAAALPALPARLPERLRIDVSASEQESATLRLAAPGSKSVTNRALALAALAAGESVLARPLVSDDVLAMAEALRALGTPIAWSGERCVISGGCGRFPRRSSASVDARLSGTTLRFITAVASLARGPVRIEGHPRLLARPLDPLVHALQAIGADVRVTELGVEVTPAELVGGVVAVPSERSSQFASALMLVAPFTRDGIRLRAPGLGATGYLELSARAIRSFGGRVDRVEADEWDVPGGQRLSGSEVCIEPDISAAAHLWSIAMVTGRRLEVVDAGLALEQPDAGVLGLFEALGATVVRTKNSIAVEGGGSIEAFDLDLRTMPDQLPTFAVLAALGRKPSRIGGVEIVRGHESDRLSVMALELRKLGAGVVETSDSLVITPRPLQPAQLATHGDHRVAMALGVLALRVPGTVIENPACVDKTFPNFWAALEAAGAQYSAA